MLSLLKLLSALCISVMALCILSGKVLASATTPLVSGNGFGFAVYDQKQNKITRFYTHPYKYEKPDPKDQLSEGLETPSLIKGLRFLSASHLEDESPSQAHYLGESHLIEIVHREYRETFFMPFSAQLNMLVACSSGRSPGVLKIEFDAENMKCKRWSQDGIAFLQFHSNNRAEILLAIPLEPNGGGKAVEYTNSGDLAGSKSWAFVCLSHADELDEAISKFNSWRKGNNVHVLLQRELAELEKWRVKPSIAFKSSLERRLWRQSELVLRMAQIRESNRSGRYNHGLIIASLPDGAWFVPWVRDMAYAVVALTHMGHKQEAKWALTAFLEARPAGKLSHLVNNCPYQISLVRYFGNGEEEPFFTMEGAVNVEYDNWGLFLYVLSDYVLKYSDKEFLNQATYRGSVYESTRDFVVKPLLANLEPYEDGLLLQADTSIWEERQKDKKHFAYSNIVAVKGLSGFARLAELKGDKALLSEINQKLELLKQGFNRAFIKEGRLRACLEPGIKNDIDGAVLSAFSLGLIDDPLIMKNTVAAMEKLRMASGGYRRVTSIVEDPAIFEYWYERQEFLFIDFLMAETLIKLGEKERADSIITAIVERSLKDNGFIPEMYVSEKNYRFKGEIGEPTGAVPMVGYGAGIYIDYLLRRNAD